MRVVPFGHVLVDGPQLEQPGFALTIEPENGEIKERYDKVCEIRANAASDWHDATPAEMTIPSSIAEEKATNPFMRAETAAELGRIRELKNSFWWPRAPFRAAGDQGHRRFLFKNARVVWLETHDKSYSEWIEMGLHFAVTHAHLDYHQSARFDDILEITTWLEWIHGASLAMAYTIICRSVLLVAGRTEHASINGEGRVRRIPKEDRARLRGAVLSNA